MILVNSHFIVSQYTIHKIKNLFISASNVVRPCLTRKKHTNMSVVADKISVLLFLLI